MPISASEPSGASSVKGLAPPVSVSAEALPVALALVVADALLVEVAVALADAFADALAEAVELAVALADIADISGHTPSGSNAVWASVPKSTLPPGLK